MYQSCHEVYEDVKQFPVQSGSFWYFTSKGSNGNAYKCLQSYGNGQGDMVVYRNSDYHSIDPVDRADCLSEAAMAALQNTIIDENCDHTPDPKAYDTCVHTTSGDPESTRTSDCDNPIPSPVPKGDQGDCSGVHCQSSGGCEKGAPVWNVNMINMNLFVTDIPLWYDPPVGPSIKIQLSYNSQATALQNKPFGKKWIFNYSSFLDEDAVTGDVTIYMPDGRQDIYLSDGGGGYSKPAAVFNTLTKVTDNSFELEKLDGTVLLFNRQSTVISSQTLLTGIKDSYGQQVSLNYKTGTDQLETINDALNQYSATLIDTDSDGLIDRIDDSFSPVRSAHFTYTNGDLTKITDMGGYWSEISYDSETYITSINNSTGIWRFLIERPDGIITSNPYPSPGESMGYSYRITITGPLGNKEEYHSLGTYSWYVSPNDYVPNTSPDSNNYKSAKKTIYFFPEGNSIGRVNKIKYPGGGYTEFKNYNPSTLKPETVIDFHGTGAAHTDETHIVNTTYNSNGLMSTYSDAKENVITFNYYSNNIDVDTIKLDLASTPENDDITLKSFTYNGNTHDISTVTERPGSPDSTTTEFIYRSNGNGQLESIINAKGTSLEMETSFIYDGTTLNLLEIQKSGNEIASFTYDTVRRIQTATDDRDMTLTYDYNDLNQVKKVTYPDTKTKIINHSSCCPRIIDSITDRAGVTTSYLYNAAKQLKEIQGPNGIIRNEYDPNGNIKKLIDEDGKETTFDYNDDNRLIKKTYPDNKFVEYDYDPAGLLTKYTNARTIEKDFTYDKNHNVLTIMYSDSTPGVTFTYDDYDRIDTRTDDIGLYDYGYDDLYRFKTIVGPWTDDTVSYTYDDLGQVKTMTPLGRQVITYDYDYDSGYSELDIGRLKAIKIGSSLTYTYDYSDVNPQVEKLTRPNASYTDYSYSPQLKRLNEIHNQTSVPSTINKHVFTYNDLDAIDTETVTTGTALPSFTSGLTTYNYNNTNQLDDRTNPDQSNDSFTYDDDGNMTQGYTPDGYQFTALYDAENRLISLSYNDSSNDYETKYFYSGDSMLAKIEKWNDTVIPGTMEKRDEVRFVRAGFLPIQERDESNTITNKYTWGLNMGGGIGGLLNLTKSGSDYSYLYDGKGNVMALIDSTEAVVSGVASFIVTGIGQGL